ncbi:MAG: tetratricopeptide repeat protein, partial [Cyclobacteriaceae bacterium]|nr:tetratricopeptide repeat protein [Cyclobacteriaceae bacterium]
AEKYFILEDYAKALELFIKSSEKDPENATAYYKIGQIHLINDALQEALINNDKAIAIDENNFYFYKLAIDIYTQMADLERAATVYEKLIAKFPLSQQSLFELASIYLYQKDFEKALSVYGKIEENFGLTENIVFQKVNVLVQMGKREEGIKVLENQIQQDSNKLSYILALAEFYIEENNNKKAHEILNDYNQQNPDNGFSRLLSGELYFSEGNFTMGEKIISEVFLLRNFPLEEKLNFIKKIIEASPDNYKKGMELLDDLLALYPDHEEIQLFKAGLLLKEGKTTETYPYFLNLSKTNTSDFEIWISLIYLDDELQYYDSMSNHSEKALEFYPNQPVLYYYHGKSKFHQTEYEEALYHLNQGKRLSSKNPELLNKINTLLGECYLYLGDVEKFKTHFEDIIHTNNPELTSRYIELMASRNINLNRAEELSEQLIKQYPSQPRYLKSYAFVLISMKKYKEGKKIIEKALNLGEPTIDLLEFYGDILFYNNMIDKAVEQWKKALELDPENELLKRKVADKKLYEK